MDPLTLFAMTAAATGQLAEGYQNFLSARLQQISLRAEADVLDYQSNILGVERRDAERAARDAMRAGEAEIAGLTMAGRQRRGAIAAAAGGRGVAGESIREAKISDQLVQDIDVYQVDVGRTRAANAAMAEATRLDTQALFARVGARARRRAAKHTYPEQYLLAGASNAATSAAAAGSYKQA